MTKEQTVLAPASLIPSGEGFIVSLGSPLMLVSLDPPLPTVCVLIPKRFVARGGYRKGVVPFLQKTLAAMLKEAKNRSGVDFTPNICQGANFKKSQPHSIARASLKGLSP